MNYSTQKILEIFLRKLDNLDEAAAETQNASEVLSVIDKEVNLLKVTDAEFNFNEAEWQTIQHFVAKRVSQIAEESENPVYKMVLAGLINAN